MKFPEALVKNFHAGRMHTHTFTSALNPYAKYMQSPNIPKNKKLRIVLESSQDLYDNDTHIDDFFNNFESMITETPDFVKNFDMPTQSFNDEFKWYKAILFGLHPDILLWSQTTMQKNIENLKEKLRIAVHAIDKELLKLYKIKKENYLSDIEAFSGQPHVFHLMSIIIDKNIVIRRQFDYEWVSFIDPHRECILVWEHDTHVGSIRVVYPRIADYISQSVDIHPEMTFILTFMHHINLYAEYKNLLKLTLVELKKIIGDTTKKKKKEIIEEIINSKI